MIFNLRQDITVDQGTDIYMSLREMTVANSEYNITDKNNSIYIGYGGVVHDFDILPGHYTVTTLMAAINAKFQVTAGLNNFSIRLNQITNQFTFLYANHTAVADHFSIIGNNRFATTHGQSMMEVLGFDFTDDVN
jgi:hypothetical protein